MSFDYTTGGPSTEGLDGQVVSPNGPMQSDQTPLLISDTLVIGETLTLTYGSRTYTVLEPLVVADRISVVQPTVNVSDTLTLVDQIALGLSDFLVISEPTDHVVGQIGSVYWTIITLPTGHADSAPYVSSITYPPSDAIGSVISGPLHIESGAIGSTLLVGPFAFPAGIVDVLTVVDHVSIILTPTDHLTITEHLTRILDVRDTLVVSELISNGIPFFERLVLVDAVYPVRDLTVSDTLTAVDGIVRVFPNAITDFVTVTETIKQVLSVRDVLTVVDSFTLTVIRHISDVLVVSDFIQRARNLTVTETLSLTDHLDVVHPNTVADTLSISDSITVLKVKAPEDVLSLTETFTLTMVKTTHLSDFLGVAETVFRIGYTVAGITGVCDEAYVPAVPLGNSPTVTLTYPYTSPSMSLTLRAPKFGNTDTFVTNTRFQRTRSGQLSVARPTAWPVIETLKLSFEALSDAQVASYQAFIDQSAAFEIGYLDHEARQWRGFITNPSLSTTQVGRGCQFNLDFEFRGKLA